MGNPVDVAKAILILLALVGIAAVVLFFGYKMLRRRLDERAEAEQAEAERFERQMMGMYGGGAGDFGLSDGGAGDFGMPDGQGVGGEAPSLATVGSPSALRATVSGDLSPQDLILHRLEGMGLLAGVERAVPLLDGRRDGVLATLKRGRRRVLILPEMPPPDTLARYGVGYDYVCLPLEGGEALVGRRLTDFLAAMGE